FGVGVELEAAEPLHASDERERAVRTRGHIGQLGRTIAADAAAAGELCAQVKLLADRQNGAGAAAASGAGVVEGARCGGRGGRGSCAGYLRAAGRVPHNGRGFSGNGVNRGARGWGVHRARIDAVSEFAQDTEYFIVAPSGIEGGLDDEVGSLVGGISGW